MQDSVDANSAYNGNKYQAFVAELSEGTGFGKNMTNTITYDNIVAQKQKLKLEQKEIQRRQLELQRQQIML